MYKKITAVSIGLILLMVMMIYPPYHKKVYPQNTFTENRHTGKMERIDSMELFLNNITYYFGKDTMQEKK